MHFFIKKTNELVKKQKIPFSKVDLIKKKGVYIRILLGSRKDKAFYLFDNQLRKVSESTPLSDFEIKCLKDAHSDLARWKEVCNTIKMSRGNKYPKDWLNVLRKEKLMVENKPEKNTSILSLLNGLIKPISNAASEENGHAPAFGLNTSSPMSTIIIVDTEPSKKNLSTAAEKNDKIFFESKIFDTGEVNKNIDFISRFDQSSIINKVINIYKDTEFEFEYPFKNLKIKTTSSIKNTKELYHFIITKIKNNQNDMHNNIIFDDIGIDYIKKIENKKYKVFFLY
jgi:hypothetical protein